jgi:hypothetical protein
LSRNRSTLDVIDLYRVARWSVKLLKLRFEKQEF